jgi:hypothetical protein
LTVVSSLVSIKIQNAERIFTNYVGGSYYSS